MGVDSHDLTHTEETRKMPFKPHWASLGHGHLICACSLAPSGLHVINMGTLQSRPELELSPRGLGIVLPWRGRSMQAQKHSLLAHTSRAKTGVSWGLTFNEGTRCCSHLGWMGVH